MEPNDAEPTSQGEVTLQPWCLQAVTLQSTVPRDSFHRESRCERRRVAEMAVIKARGVAHSRMSGVRLIRLP
jgi:hypothetical protein